MNYAWWSTLTEPHLTLDSIAEQAYIEDMDGFSERYDLGIKDYLIGGGLWVIRLLTRQYGHQPVISKPHETPPNLPETIAYADPLEHIHDLVDDRPPHLNRWEDTSS